MHFVLLLVLTLGEPSSVSSSSESVESLAQRAFEANKAGRYQEAVKLYLRGYDLTPLSSLLYNVAAIYDRRLKDPALASDFYRRYAAAPDAEPELVKKSLTRLEQIQQEQRSRVAVAAVDDPPRDAPKAEPQPVTPTVKATEPVVTTSTPAPAPPSAGAGRWVAIGLGVAAAAAIGVGVGFGLNAVELSRQADLVCSGATCSTANGVTLTRNALTSANVANISIGAGAAVGVVALVVGLVTASPAPSTSVSLAPVPGGGVVVLGGAL